YHTAPADSLSFLENGSVDSVVIVLAIQNIENLSGTFSECARILKKGGRLFMVINHPAFRIPKRSSWQWEESNSFATDENPDSSSKLKAGEDSNSKKQYRRVDAYMSERCEKIDMTPGESSEAKKKFTVTFHRPLQVFFKALKKSGFAVTRLEEWISHKKSEKGPRAEEEDRMRKEIPMFLCFEAIVK
ncbi:MAG: methyltransferase domain-containing protein, partial [Candidatus Taylorbacteria bacterium]|nr:methyltransferase domain-containing protein [Candidatus Taylorbacteria bacterium]